MLTVQKRPINFLLPPAGTHMESAGTLVGRPAQNFLTLWSVSTGLLLIYIQRPPFGYW